MPTVEPDLKLPDRHALGFPSRSELVWFVLASLGCPGKKERKQGNIPPGSAGRFFPTFTHRDLGNDTRAKGGNLHR